MALLVIAAVAASLLAPYPPNQLVAAPLTAPGASHLLGTDTLGRDMLSRLIYATRPALIIGPTAALLGVTLGAIVGVVSAYLGRWADELVARFVDGLLPIPTMLLMLVIITAFGTSTAALIIGLALVQAIPTVRVFRSATRAIMGQDFIVAARARGESHWGLLRHEICPNLATVVAVELPVRASFCITLASSLSFLGVGIAPPTADWGAMIADSRSFVTLAPWTLLAPIAALALLVVAINVLAGALARRWNPEEP
ncbi:ABC transporter permease [Nocardia sp. NPDC059239]|uniref:ABC transporter permease n=1 Tax=Nocardia sp. NPDC059239 TaxID=3346785 RepID=UPI0036CA62C1